MATKELIDFYGVSSRDFKPFSAFRVYYFFAYRYNLLKLKRLPLDFDLSDFKLDLTDNYSAIKCRFRAIVNRY